MNKKLLKEIRESLKEITLDFVNLTFTLDQIIEEEEKNEKPRNSIKSNTGRRSD